MPNHLSEAQIQQAVNSITANRSGPPRSHLPQNASAPGRLQVMVWNNGGLAYQELMRWLDTVASPPDVLIVLETRLAYDMELIQNASLNIKNQAQTYFHILQKSTNIFSYSLKKLHSQNIIGSSKSARSLFHMGRTGLFLAPVHLLPSDTVVKFCPTHSSLFRHTANQPCALQDAGVCIPPF